MKGVIVDDFETAIKNNTIRADEIKGYMKDINDEFNLLTKNIKGKDLDFLTSRLALELTQMGKVKSKIDAYNEVLKNVLLSYKRESETLTKNIRDL